MKILSAMFQSSVVLPGGQVTHDAIKPGTKWDISAHAQGVLITSKADGSTRLYPWSRVAHMDVDVGAVRPEVALRDALPAKTAPDILPPPLPRRELRNK